MMKKLDWQDNLDIDKFFFCIPSIELYYFQIHTENGNLPATKISFEICWHGLIFLSWHKDVSKGVSVVSINYLCALGLKGY